MEQKNILIGSIWIALFLMLGGFLEMKLGSAGEEWLDSSMRSFFKTAHLHGAVFGILNILYGLMIRNLRLSGGLISAGSWLAIVGAVVFPVALFMAGFLFEAVKLAPIGGGSMILAWILMSAVVFQSKG